MTLTGIVVSGRKLGQKMGFPTANLELISETKSLEKGVYTVLVNHNSDKYLGVMNVGFRPTVDGVAQKNLTVEVHVLNFNQQIYGDFLNITPLNYIRGEKKFDSLDDLKNQITKDIQVAHQMFFEIDFKTRV